MNKSTKGQILKNVPIPQRPTIYRWEDMDIGDCLFIAAAQHDAPKEHWRMASSARYNGLKLGFKFTVRLMDDGVRAWRIA